MQNLEFDCGVKVVRRNFVGVFGRPPRDQDEFVEFGKLCEKGVQAQIHWKPIFQGAKEIMQFSWTFEVVEE